MTRTRALDEAGGGFEYVASIPATGAVQDYTPRLLPNHPQVAIPLEASEILWQR
jgi:starch phosphorylase